MGAVRRLSRPFRARCLRGVFLGLRSCVAGPSLGWFAPLGLAVRVGCMVLLDYLTTQKSGDVTIR
jgi:hypothetical protein